MCLQQVDYLFDGIISSPTVDEHKLTLEGNIRKSRLQQMGQHISHAAHNYSSAATAGVISSAGRAVNSQRAKMSFILDETTRVVSPRVLQLLPCSQCSRRQSD